MKFLYCSTSLRNLGAIALLIAVASPYFLVHNVVVLPSFYNEAVAMLSWGIVCTVIFFSLSPQKSVLRSVWPAVLIMGLQIILLIGRFIAGQSTPYVGIMLYTTGTLCAAVACTLAGAHVQNKQNANVLGAVIIDLGAWLAAGIGTIQTIYGWLQYLELNIYFPFISLLNVGGRVYGNIRQPNNYALLITVSIVSMLWLADRYRQHSPRITWALYVMATLSTGAVALSASRIGMVLLCGVATWGVFEFVRDRSRGIALMSMSFWYFIFRGVFTVLDNYDVLAYYGSLKHLSVGLSANGDRLQFWYAAIKLVLENPLWGVGLDRFAYAVFTNGLSWQTTPHLENAHNFILQWAIEYGVLIAALLMVLLTYGLWKCRYLMNDFTGRALLFALLAPLIHSLVEYPLQYIYFLLPWSFLWGIALVRSSKYANGESMRLQTTSVGTTMPIRQVPMWVICPLILMCSTVFFVYEFSKVAPLYKPDSTKTFVDRVQLAYQTAVFTNMADAAAMELLRPSPSIAETQFQLAKKVAMYRFNSSFLFSYFQAAALSDRPCWAKAIAFRLKVADKVAFIQLQNIVANSEYPSISELKSYMAEPYFVRWPTSEHAKCEEP